MTGRIKKARQQQELDQLVFNVLASFRHQGAMQWVDWHETTCARRGQGKKRLGTTTFSDAVKRLTAEGRVQIDGDGCYRVAYDDVAENLTANFPPAGIDRSLGAFSGARNGKEDIADIAVQQLLNK